MVVSPLLRLFVAVPALLMCSCGGGDSDSVPSTNQGITFDGSRIQHEDATGAIAADATIVFDYNGQSFLTAFCLANAGPTLTCASGNVTGSLTFKQTDIQSNDHPSPISASLAAAGYTLNWPGTALRPFVSCSFINSQIQDCAFLMQNADESITIGRGFSGEDLVSYKPSRGSGNDVAGVAPVPGKWTLRQSIDIGKNLGAGDSDDLSSCMCAAPDTPQNWVGDLVNSATGNKFQIESDFAAPSTTGIALTRFYNSLDQSTTGFGAGWRHQWQRSIEGSIASGTVQFTREDGRVNSFIRNAGGVWEAEADITLKLTVVTDSANKPTGWLLTRPDDSQEFYSSAGNLLLITARNGRKTSLSYDSSGKLSAVIGPFGHSLRFFYSNGFLSEIAVPDGGTYEYSYDANGNLRTVTYPDKSKRSYLYENVEHPRALTGIVDERGNRYSTIDYDTSGRAISTAHAGGADLTGISYDDSNLVRIVNARGVAHTRTTIVQFGVAKLSTVSSGVFPAAGGAKFSYDQRGFLSSRADWNGNLTTFVHDAQGNETSRTEASSSTIARSFGIVWLSGLHLPRQIIAPTQTTNFTYDNHGNVLSRTESSGTASRTWSATYSPLGQVLTATDPRGSTSSYTYDARGNVISFTDALGHKTQIPGHDANGRPTRIIDPNGLATTIAYDARGRTIARNVGGLVTRYVYDAAGNLVSTINPDGAKLSMTYDAAHRLVRVADSLGNQIAYALDANGNRISIAVFDPANALSRTVSYAYDAADRITKVIGAQGQTTSLTRDNNGNIVKVTDPIGAVTQSAYDALNRRVSSVDAMGGVTTFAYDGADRTVSVTDPRHLTTSYAYNGLGDLLQTTSPDTGVTTQAFDAVGNAISSTDARGLTVSRSYDALRRLTGLTYAGGHQIYQYDAGIFGIGHLTQVSGTSDTTSFAYDLLGHLLSKQQTVGTSNLTQRYAFNALGQLVSSTYPSGMTVAYGYDAAGHVASLNVDGSAFLTDIRHEPFGPVKAWSWGGQAYTRTHDADGRLSAFTLGQTTRALVYDAAGRITAYNDASGLSQDFGYDLLGRLTGYTSPTASQAYSYDADGNRTSLTGSAGSSAYTYESTSNRLVSKTGLRIPYSYDAAGNLLSNGTASFSYDGLGRMTGSVVGAMRSARTLYTTNGLGQRVLKSSASGSTWFLYDDNSQLLGEYGAGNTLETIHFDGMPVAVRNGGRLLRIYADQLDAPRLVVDAAGSQLWSWDGDPFGNVVPRGSITFYQRFPGQYADPETGLYYNMARHYSPASGRYVQSDPIGLAGGLNTYSYSLSAPVTVIDPRGLAGEWTCAKLGDCTHLQSSSFGFMGNPLKALFEQIDTQEYLERMEKMCKGEELLEKFGVKTDLPLPVIAAQQCLCKLISPLKWVDNHADDIAKVLHQLGNLDQLDDDTADWQYRHAHDPVILALPPSVDPNHRVAPSIPPSTFDPVFR